MLPWFRRATIDCHFCGQASSLYKGKNTTRSFKCQNCACINFLQVDGTLDEDYHELFGNSSLPANTESFSKRARTTALAQQPAFVFCRDCQRNQELQLHLLASYYGDEATYMPPEEQARLDANLESYKMQLEDRYPSVCEQCGGPASKILRKRDTNARAIALNNKIMGSSPNKQTSNRDPRVSWRFRRDGFLWRVKGILWASQLLFTFAMYTAAAFWPTTIIDWWHRYSFLQLLSGLLPAFFVSFFNPLWNQHRLARIRHSDSRIYLKNQGPWNTAQLWVYCLRSCLLFGLGTTYFVKHSRIVSLSCLFISTILLAVTFSFLRIQLPPSIKLVRSRQPSAKSKTSRPSTPTAPTSSDFIHPIFGHITPVNNQIQQEIQQPHDPNAMEVDDDDGYVFRTPPKANHESTGLESLLTSVLGMRDGPALGDVGQENVSTRWWIPGRRQNG